MARLRCISPAVAAAIATLSIIGWLTGNETLKRGLVISNTVNPMTAVLIILDACGVLAHGLRPWRHAAWGFGVAGVALAAVILHSIIFGWSGAPDTWLFHGVPSRTAPMAAASLGLIGAAIILLKAGQRGALVAQSIAVLVLVPPLAALVGYVEELNGLVAIGQTAPMAILTALSIVALATGLLLAEPGRGFMAPLSEGAAARIAARLIPVGVMVPIGFEWTSLYGMSHGWFSPNIGRPLPVLGSVALLTGAAWWTAHSVAIAEKLRGEKAALTDISEQLASLAAELRVARDRAENADAAKSRFLATISHELRTPLNGILGYAQILQLESGEDTAQAARIASMLAAGQHLLQMINCVLDFSQIETGRIELNIAETDVIALCRASLDVVRPAADAKGLRLRDVNGVGAVCRLATDATRLRQVILNLLGNAVKFTEAGEVSLILGFSADMHLLLSVSDTGPGLSEEQRGRLFRSFERLGLDSSLEGAGLGLAIAARLVDRMGGRIGCNPGAEGRGCVFWVEFPGDVILTRTAESAQADADGHPARMLRVLVVDDVDINQAVAAAALRAAGHHVVCVDSGEKAVREAATGTFDVVLMDVRMPVMDGLEATRRIRAMGGDMARLPILAVTAHAFAEQIDDCRSAGMDGHISKPFEFSALVKTVETMGEHDLRHAEAL